MTFPIPITLPLPTPETTLDYFLHYEATTPDGLFLKQAVGAGYQDYTWREAADQARRVAGFLQKKYPAQAHIGILSKNGPHWIMADMAIALAGMVSVPFYPTLTADQLRALMAHSHVAALFVGPSDRSAAGQTTVPDVPASVRVILFPGSGETIDTGENHTESWTGIIADNEPLTNLPVARPDDLLSIVYTSGTTGTPKGVLISREVSQQASVHTASQMRLDVAGGTRFFSYLPLCHIAERGAVETNAIRSGGTIYFPESLDTFAQNLRDAQPTHFFAVPRIWTRFQMGILARFPPDALAQALRHPAQRAAVGQQIRQELGLDQAMVVLTGAAPMPVSLIAWYADLGIQIREGYGMSENMGVCTVMPADAVRNGTVGKPYPGVTLKTDPDTGEILMQSPWNTPGYYNEPALTAALFQNGFLRTGDVGHLDADGYLTITGRGTDYFKTAKGEYVAPAPIEAGFAANPFVEQVCVLGTNLPQPIALVVLSVMGGRAEVGAVVGSLDADIDRINAGLVNYEQLRKIVIVPDMWSVENDLLTPTLKIKRHRIETRYQSQVAGWYGQPERVVWGEG